MFRFTIRDVLWLMVVVGLGVGWWRSYCGQIVETRMYQEKWNTLNHAIWASGMEVVDASSDHTIVWPMLVPKKDETNTGARQASAGEN